MARTAPFGREVRYQAVEWTTRRRKRVQHPSRTLHRRGAPYQDSGRGRVMTQSIMRTGLARSPYGLILYRDRVMR